MGSLIGFELVRELRRIHGLMPVHFIASGSSAPHIVGAEEKVHPLPDTEFKRHLRALNGTPPRLFESAELMDAVLPALRADFSVCETYTYMPKLR